MMDTMGLPCSDLEGYRHHDRRRYSVWVYEGDEIIRVFPERAPNTVEIWFEFHEFTCLYWQMMESECVEQVAGAAGMYYNFTKMKRFMLEYMVAGTNFPGIEIRHGADGRVDDATYDALMRVHPRIYQVLFDKVIKQEYLLETFLFFLLTI